MSNARSRTTAPGISKPSPAPSHIQPVPGIASAGHASKSRPDGAHPDPGIADLYVLYRAQGSARYPFVAAWIQRHRLSAGFLMEHARRFQRVVVIGPPDGLVLPDSCRVAYVQADEAERRFAADPRPSALFGEE